MLTVTLDDQTEAALDTLMAWYANIKATAAESERYRPVSNLPGLAQLSVERPPGKTAEGGAAAVPGALERLDAEDLGPSLTPDTLFADAAQRWLHQFRVDAENGICAWASVDTYSDHLRNHVLPTLGTFPLSEVTTPMINDLCQWNLQNYSLCLAKHTKVVVSNVMTFSVQAGAIDRNPAKEIDKLVGKRAKAQKKAARALTKREVLDLLAKLDADAEAVRRDLPDLVRFFIATGERLGEAVGAHWSDFDRVSAAVSMTGNIIQVRGKGVVRNTGKSQMARRTIPLPTWCVQMLENRQAKLGFIDVDKPIFSNSQGGYINTSNLNNRYWMPFRKRAGYEWVTFHTFRKTVATLLDGAGLTARQIADILGHANPSMTQNVYMGRGQVSRDGASALDKITG